jgi:short-subunit dehydrogenase
MVVDRNKGGARETVNMIGTNGGYGKAYYVDVTNQQEIKNFFVTVLKEHKRIDYLFNNAGVSVDGEFQDITMEHWRHVLDVNLWGTVYGCHYVYPVMRQQGFGHIINTASLAGLIPGGLTSCYSASKHAVVGLSLTLRSEAKQYGIKVSALCPGMIRTDILNTTPKVTGYLNSPENRARTSKMKLPAPDDVVKKIIRGVVRNKGIIVVPVKHKMYWWIHRIFPEFIPNMFHRIIRMMK